MKTIRFNTGRNYTAHGQRIVATLHNDNVVTFADHDRCINGEFKLGDKIFNNATVMSAYDFNDYTETKRSWEDYMQRGGCNLWVYDDPAKQSDLSKVSQPTVVSHSLLLDQFERELARQWTTFNVHVHSFQVVKEGYLVIYDLIPNAPTNPLGEYERLAFFNKKLENKNDIILR